jgi:hypothetical protein
MRRRANENRLFSIAVTLETAWPLLSSVGPLRREHKIRAMIAAMSLALRNWFSLCRRRHIDRPNHRPNGGARIAVHVIVGLLSKQLSR